MDEITDWTSIIVFIVAGIASLIKYAKKGREVPPNTAVPEAEFPWEMEEEMSNSSESPSPTWEQREQEEQIPRYTATQEENKMVAVATLLTKPMDFVEEEKQQESIVEQKERVEPQTTLEFDLRQAIISNVILRRPDF